MASTYTNNSGLEKIGSGEQAGTWGTTTNNNLDIVDRTVNGVLSLTVSGNTTLTASDGTLSNGHYKIIILGGTPSGANGATNIVYADGSGSNANVALVPTDLVNDTTPQLGGNLDTNGKSILFGSSKWSIILDTGDNDLLFKYNGTTVFKLASTGAVTSANNITAFGSP